MTALPMVLMSDEEVAVYGRHVDAGFGALQTERGLLPLVAMHVEARVTGVIAAIELTILGRYRGRAGAQASIELSGTSLGDPLREQIMRTADVGSPRAIDASWARARIRDLEDRYATGARELEHEIVTLSKRFTVLSRFTAFLAIDRSEVANAGGKVRQIVQPVETPAGWEGGAVAAAPAGRARGAKMMQRSVNARSASSMAAPMAMAPPRAAPRAQAMSPGAVRPPRPTECSPMPSMPQSINVPPGPPATYGQGSYERHEDRDSPAADKAELADAYLVQLATLARELVAQAGGADLAAIRVLRQRLTQWVEDVRSVGGPDQLATAVEQVVNRLSAALAGTTPGPELKAVAAELARLAAGATPLPGVPGGKPRRAFWK